MLILHDVIVQMFAVEHIPYSQFVKTLEDGKVIEVAITQDRIQGKMKVVRDGQEVEKAFSTVMTTLLSRQNFPDKTSGRRQNRSG